MRAVTVFTLCILAGSVLAKPKLKVKDLTDYNGVKIVKDKAKITVQCCSGSNACYLPVALD